MTRPALTKIATCYPDDTVQPGDPQWGRYVTVHRDNTVTKANRVGRFVCATVGAMSRTAESCRRLRTESEAIAYAASLGYPSVIR